MSIRSINEPATSRVVALSPVSINEPLDQVPMDPPVLSGIDPDSAVIGGPDLTMTVTGSGFGPGTVITFNGGEETTAFVDSRTLTTIVKPSTATTPGTYPVTVFNPLGESVAAGFTFTAAEPEPELETAGAGWGDPDELEDEIEQAEADGEFTALHASRTTVTVKKKPTTRR